MVRPGLGRSEYFVSSTSFTWCRININFTRIDPDFWKKQTYVLVLASFCRIHNSLIFQSITWDKRKWWGWRESAKCHIALSRSPSSTWKFLHKPLSLSPPPQTSNHKTLSTLTFTFSLFRLTHFHCNFHFPFLKCSTFTFILTKKCFRLRYFLQPKTSLHFHFSHWNSTSPGPMLFLIKMSASRNVLKMNSRGTWVYTIYQHLHPPPPPSSSKGWSPDFDKYCKTRVGLDWEEGIQSSRLMGRQPH